jgi:hypothetical protein
VSSQRRRRASIYRDLEPTSLEGCRLRPNILTPVVYPYTVGVDTRQDSNPLAVTALFIAKQRLLLVRLLRVDTLRICKEADKEPFLVYIVDIRQ